MLLSKDQNVNSLFSHDFSQRCSISVLLLFKVIISSPRLAKEIHMLLTLYKSTNVGVWSIASSISFKAFSYAKTMSTLTILNSMRKAKPSPSD